MIKKTNMSEAIATQQTNSRGFFGESFLEGVVEIFRPRNRVVVLSLKGIIGKESGGITMDNMRLHIEQAFKSSKSCAVCLAINSPGGSPAQSEMVANMIMRLSQEKKIPVYSFVQDVAASGGYWLACAGSRIYALKSSIVGSIGVISAGFGLHEALAKIGVERRVYTAGKNKSILDPFLPSKEADIKLLKKIQNNIHAHFIEHVKTRRAGKLTQNDELLFNGEFWTGETAMEYGLVDGICDMHEFIAEQFGAKAKVEYIGSKPSWLKSKLGLGSVSAEVASGMAQGVVDAADRYAQRRFDVW